MTSRRDARTGMLEPRRRGVLLAGTSALLAGLLLRGFFILRFPRTAGDPMIYMDFARTLLEQHVYGYTWVVRGVPVPHPSLIRLPGYPLFLAACFAIFGHGSVRAVLWVQGLVDLATCALAALTAARLFGSRAGWFALWLSVLCPFTATYVAAPLTETAVLFTIALAFYALVRWQETLASQARRWLLVLASALAYSILLRPDQGLLAIAVVSAVLWFSPGHGIARFRPGLFLSALTLLPLVPWTVRNERTMHVFQPLAPRGASDPGELISVGFNRWYRTWGIDFATNETVYWSYNSDPILPDDLPSRAFDSEAQKQETAALLEEYNQTTTETPVFDARFEALARERIHGHLFRYYFWLPAMRVADMLLRPRTEMIPVHDDWWKPHKHGELPTLIAAGVYFALNLVYFALGLTGFLSRRKLASDPRVALPILWAMAASIGLRILLLLTLDNAEPRYTLEFFPILFVLGGAWLGRATSRRPFSRRPSRAFRQ